MNASRLFSGSTRRIGLAVLAGWALLPTAEAAQSFAYVANAKSNNVSAYAINAATGALTPVAGSPFAAGIGADSVTVDPAGKFAYVANNQSNNVSAYAINAATGALTAVAGSPFGAGLFPGSVTVDPAGKFAYVANVNSNNVSAYTINGATGALTEVAGSPFAVGSFPDSVTVDPTGKFLYVVNQGGALAGNISAYTINTATGALTPVVGSPFAAGFLPHSVTVDPTGKFAYVAGLDIGVSAYTINTATGALTAVAGSPFRAGTDSDSVTVDPRGKFIYVANYTSNDLSAYTINPVTGALTAVAGSPFAAGSNPRSVTVDPAGKFAYVANRGDNNVWAYIINGVTGALTAVAGSPFAVGSFPESVVTATPLTGAAPALSKVFIPATISSGAPVALSFTINNPSLTAATGASFTDPLPCGLVVASPNAVSGSCGAGVITASPGTTTVSLGGGSIPASRSCTFSINLVSAGSTGVCVNTTSPLVTNEFGSRPPATDTLIQTGPPVIVSRFPAAGATGVTASQIDVTFDRPMDRATFNASSLTLRAAGASSNVPGFIYVSGAATSLVLSTPLMPLTAYTVTIAGTVTDTNGVPLGSPATWTFTTGGNSGPPSIVARFPAVGAAGVTSSEVDVTFNLEMNAATFNSSTFTLRAAGATSNVPAQIIVFAARVSLVPFAALARSTAYTVTIAGTVTDANGIALGTPVTWTFTTY